MSWCNVVAVACIAAVFVSNIFVEELVLMCERCVGWWLVV